MNDHRSASCVSSYGAAMAAMAGLRVTRWPHACCSAALLPAKGSGPQTSAAALVSLPASHLKPCSTCAVWGRFSGWSCAHMGTCVHVCAHAYAQGRGSDGRALLAAAAAPWHLAAPPSSPAGRPPAARTAPLTPCCQQGPQQQPRAAQQGPTGGWRAASARAPECAPGPAAPASSPAQVKMHPCVSWPRDVCRCAKAPVPA